MFFVFYFLFQLFLFSHFMVYKGGGCMGVDICILGSKLQANQVAYHLWIIKHF